MNRILPIVEKMLDGKSENGIIIGSSSFLGIATLDASESPQSEMPFGGTPSSCSVSGVTVEQVIVGSPAAKAGILAGDVITAFDGTAVTSDAELKTLILEHRPGAPVQVTYTTASGTIITVSLHLGTGPVA